MSAVRKKKPHSVARDPYHPIWGIAKVFLAVLVLTVILHYSANTFDNTELETIGWFAAIFTIIQGGHEIAKRTIK